MVAEGEDAAGDVGEEGFVAADAGYVCRAAANAAEEFVDTVLLRQEDESRRMEQQSRRRGFGCAELTAHFGML